MRPISISEITNKSVHLGLICCFVAVKRDDTEQKYSVKIINLSK